MSISSPFVRRPVATLLLTLGLVLSGVLAFRLLPVSALPQVDFPTFSIEASMPGASPENLAATIATPLERQLGRIAGVTEMTSSSSQGRANITLQFDIDRDINGAAREVQAAINAARTQLPAGLPSNPRYRKVNLSEHPIMSLAMTSDAMTKAQIYDVASTVVAQRIAQIKGIGQVSFGGGAPPAVRVSVNPAALNNYGLSLEDVRAAIAATNVNKPKGAVEYDGRRWQITANDQALKARDYASLIVGYRDGATLRLSDVAEVTDSVENTLNYGLANGKPAVMLTLNREPDANVVETVDRVKAALPELRALIPPAVHLEVIADRTPTIRASMHEVEATLVIAVGLVILVVFLFLRNGRATLIPAITLPASLIGTFGVMYLLGYSLNNLSLMALIIATGFVVDDAIVVLENIARHIEDGMAPLHAALQGAREVGFTVVSMSVSLIAVFIPIMFMGGIVGRFFREFAVTLSVAVLISLVLSLTTAPMLCSRLLKHVPAKPEKGWGRISERAFAWLHGHYERSLTTALRHSGVILAVLLAVIGLNIYLYTIVPKGFFPQQDTGRVSGRIVADQSVSFQAMKQKFIDYYRILEKDPAVAAIDGWTGGGNSANITLTLKPLAERKVSADEVIARLRKKLGKQPGAALNLQSVQDIHIGGRQSDAQFQFSLESDNLADLREYGPRVLRALRELPDLADVNSDMQENSLQVMLDIDRAAAARLGVTTRQIDTTLYSAFGQRQVSNIYTPLNQYRVVLEVNSRYGQNPEALQEIRIRNAAGELVPLSAISSYKIKPAARSVNHQGQFASSTISFNLPVGVPLSKAMASIDGAMDKLNLPSSIHGSYQSTAKLFQSSLSSQPLLILAAILAVYVVLGVLYESYIHPVTILSTLPSAGIGALLTLLATGVDFTLMAFIAVILLIGIVMKNAIMMIDFALHAEREHQLTSEQAIYRACSLRFRPILMTTVAAVMGAMPLVLSHGEGWELRYPLGISIVGGLLVSQILTLYTTPVVYLYLDRLSLWFRQWRATRASGEPLSGRHETSGAR